MKVHIKTLTYTFQKMTDEMKYKKEKRKPKKRLNNEVLFISMLVNFSTINMCTYGSRIIMNEIKFNVRLNIKLDWIG